MLHSLTPSRLSALCGEHVRNLFPSLVNFHFLPYKANLFGKRPLLSSDENPLYSQSPSCHEQGINSGAPWESGRVKMAATQPPSGWPHDQRRGLAAASGTSFPSRMPWFSFYHIHLVFQAKRSIFLNIFPPVSLRIGKNGSMPLEKSCHRLNGCPDLQGLIVPILLLRPHHRLSLFI